MKHNKPGRPAGSKTTDNIKLGISISRKNAEWLKRQKAGGQKISRVIDFAIDTLRYDKSNY